jgi:ATP phosphoribosyltransferase
LGALEPSAEHPGQHDAPLRLALALDGSLLDVLELLAAAGVPVPEKLRGRTSGAPHMQPGLLWAAADEAAGEVAPARAGGAAHEDSPAEGAEAPAVVSEKERPGGLAALEVVAADPWDVAVLVERGAADAGVLPKHVAAETRPDVFEVLDLHVGLQRLAHVEAGSPASRGRLMRVATAHPQLARAYFARAGTQIETLALRSAAELAATLRAVDGAVLALPLGKARTAAGLDVRGEVLRSSARLVVNRSSRVVRAVELGLLVDRLRAVIRSRQAGAS